MINEIDEAKAEQEYLADRWHHVEHLKLMHEMIEDEIHDLLSIDGGLGAEDDVEVLARASAYFRNLATFHKEDMAEEETKQIRRKFPLSIVPTTGGKAS